MSGLVLQGVGLGWRQELAAELLTRREAVDFVEVVAETCFVQSTQRREAIGLSRVWPVIPHGVKLSLGSAGGIDDERARRLGDLARDLRAPMVTEHVALTSAGGHEIGHLTQLPRTREAVAVVARNVERVRRYLPEVPFALENIAWTLRWPDDEMNEEDFYCEVTRATGCPLLLDLGNLHANAMNEGRDPLAVLAGYPLSRVAMVHIAGGHREGNFYYDDHASPVPDGVFELLEALVRARGAVPVLLERDANFPSFDELTGELDRARMCRGLKPTALGVKPVRRAIDVEPASRGLHPVCRGFQPAATLATTQEALARALTDRDAVIGDALAGFRADDLARSREMLQRKRVDDALPLLPRLAAHGSRLAAIARTAIDAQPRPPRGAAVSDAWRIGVAAEGDAAMAGDARVDLLVLRARFKMPTVPGMVPAARVAPFVGSATTRGGRRMWALKAPGASAAVRLLERQT